MPIAAYVWLALLLLFGIVEAATAALTSIWFAAGALVAMVAALLSAPLWLQIVLFLVVSIVLLVLTRPIALKYFNNKRQSTNVESMIGRQGVVLEDIDTIKSQGLVEVDGETWSARTDEPEGVIPKDTIVSVEGVQGVKLIVKKKEEL